jgi:hypothetical protein
MKSETLELNRRSFALKGLSIAGAVFGVASFTRPALAQGYRFNPEHRRPVEVTVHDLEEVSAHARSDGRERERYENAIRHLHEFGERLREGGGFDKGKLDQAIGDVQSVIDHNHLSGMAHDRLFRDVTELRRLREHYDERYRYGR